MQTVLALVVGLTLLNAAPGQAECTPDASAKPPHVIFFLVDDVGFNDISWNNPDVNTPNLQAMAEQGIILDRNYAQPVCSPSRAALQSGMFAHRTGSQHSVINPDVPECLSPSIKILPEELKEHGYATHMLGKWHLGFCDIACTPLQRGYDSFYGFLNAKQDHFEHTMYGLYEFWDQDEMIDVRGQYTQSLMTARAQDIIANHDTSTPLFLMFSSPLAHTPMQLADHSVPNNNFREFFIGMLEEMDKAFGTLVQSAKDAGIYDDTLFVFTSDNGGQAGGGGVAWASNAPLRGAKGSSWEGGTRVPGMVYSSRQTVTNVRTTEMIHIVDWYPTILAMGGTCPTSDVDGLSQTDLILNNGPSVRDRFVYNVDQYHPYTFGNGVIRLGDYKLIHGYPGNYDGYHADGPVGKTYHTDPFKVNDLPDEDFDIGANWSNEMIYAKKAEGRQLLFNVMEDPEERNDLAADMPDKVAEMEKLLDEYFAEAVELDLEHLVPDPESYNYGGNWMPGWCDGLY